MGCGGRVEGCFGGGLEMRAPREREWWALGLGWRSSLWHLMELRACFRDCNLKVIDSNHEGYRRVEVHDSRCETRQ